MRKTFYAFVVVVMGLLALTAFAQEFEDKRSDSPAAGMTSLSVDLPTAEQRSPVAQFKVRLTPATAKPGARVTLNIVTTVADGWHIYPVASADKKVSWPPTKIEFLPEGLEAVDDSFSPSVAAKEVKAAGEVQQYHDGTFEWSRTYRVLDDANTYAGVGSIRFQACNDKLCMPPKTLTFTLKARKETSAAKVVDGDVASDDESQLKPIGDPIVVSLEDCEKTRPKVKLSILSLLLFGAGSDKLTLQGSFDAEGERTTVFLPQQRSYSIENTVNGNSRFENTSTYISLDRDGDGSISNGESFATSHPIRMKDAMFKVTEINKDAKTITFQKVDVPLSDTIVNRRCPPFEYTTTAGKTITDKSILGKVTILDIWAVT